MRAELLHGILAICTAGFGCTVQPDDSNPFGTAPVTSAPPVGDTGDTMTSSSGGASGSEEESTAGSSPSTGADDGGSTGPDPTTGDTLSGTSSGDGAGDGTQPGMGMYSPCTVPEDCGFAPNLCITINDAGGMLLGGFCSQTGCNTPAVDCDPAPSVSVTPVCVPVTVNMVADTACALQCAGGAACPPPMQCLNVMGLGEVCA